MKPYWIKTNRIIKILFPNLIWAFHNKEKKVYLTFDDGPTPEITEWVLTELEKYNAKATFFCIGKNIDQHPEIFKKVIEKGHHIGNHTYNHLNGWKTNTLEYIENSVKCAECIKQNSNNKQLTNNNQLFRPPYGKIKPSQAKKLRLQGYKIIMWDVLSADFDQNISKEECLTNVLKHTQSGSIIVFHDSIKAFKNLEYALPRTLKYLTQNNYSFETI